MSRPLVTDEFWDFVESELPELPPPDPRGGRPPVGNRQALTGIMFVLRFGVPWQALPTELGCGSGSTCWRRLRDWTRTGVWQRIQEKLLQKMADEDVIEACMLVIDSASVRALQGGDHTGPNPTDRGKNGCKRHVITDRDGTPLVAWTTAANIRDDMATPEGMLELELLSDQVPALIGDCALPVILGDRGYGFQWLIDRVREHGWLSLLSPRGADKPHGSGLGVARYVVERTLAWFGNYRRIKFCYERTGRHFQAMHDLALIDINFQRLAKAS